MRQYIYLFLLCLLIFVAAFGITMSTITPRVDSTLFGGMTAEETTRYTELAQALSLMTQPIYVFRRQEGLHKLEKLAETTKLPAALEAVYSYYAEPQRFDCIYRQGKTKCPVGTSPVNAENTKEALKWAHKLQSISTRRRDVALIELIRNPRYAPMADERDAATLIETAKGDDRLALKAAATLALFYLDPRFHPEDLLVQEANNWLSKAAKLSEKFE